MGLRKSHVKKGNPRVCNWALFGITDKAESVNLMRNSEASLPSSLNYKTGKLVQNAILEAEHRKAQAITLTRQTFCKENAFSKTAN